MFCTDIRCSDTVKYQTLIMPDKSDADKLDAQPISPSDAQPISPPNTKPVTKPKHRRKKTIPKHVPAKYVYTKEMHLKYKLDRLTESQSIPDDVIAQIKAFADRMRICLNTVDNIRLALRKTYNHMYMEHSNKILKQLNPSLQIRTKSEECAVCLDEFDIFEKLECGHYFCSKCIIKISNTFDEFSDDFGEFDEADPKIRCPLCRAEQNIDTARIKSNLLEQISADDKKRVVAYFEQNKDAYARGRGLNMMPFDFIVRDIISKLNILRLEPEEE